MPPSPHRWIGLLVFLLMPLAGLGIYALWHISWPTVETRLIAAGGASAYVPPTLPPARTTSVAPARSTHHEGSVFPGPVTAQVLKVMDGDTLLVRVAIWLEQGMETRVRLAGADTPERRGKCAFEKRLAEQARQRTEALVASGTVILYDIQHDKYGGRVRARVVTAGGNDLAQTLIREGLARAYHGETRQSWCRDTE